MRLAKNVVGISAVISSLFMAVGCGDDIDQPTDEDYDEVASSVAPLFGHNLSASGTIETAVQVSRGSAPLWLTIQADGAYAGSAVGITWHLDAHCRDASGAAMAACDETASAASVAAEVTGDVDLGVWQVSFAAATSSTLSGLQSAEITASGSADITSSSEYMGIFGQSSFELELSADYDVVVAADGSVAPRGRASAVVDVRRHTRRLQSESDVHFLIDAVISLPGDGTATLTLDGDAAYELDLAGGSAARTGN